MLKKQVENNELHFPICMNVYVKVEGRSLPGFSAVAGIRRSKREHLCGTTACLLGNAASYWDSQIASGNAPEDISPEQWEKAIGSMEDVSELLFGIPDVTATPLTVGQSEKLRKDLEIPFHYLRATIWKVLFHFLWEDDSDHAGRIQYVLDNLVEIK